MIDTELSRIRPPSNKRTLGRFMEDLPASSGFRTLVTLLILIQIVLMMTYKDNMVRTHRTILESYSYFMTIATAIELTLRFLGKGRSILAQPWFLFDAAVLLLCLYDSGRSLHSRFHLHRTPHPLHFTTLRLLRVGELYRYLPMKNVHSPFARISRSIRKLQIILESFFSSLSALPHIAALLFVVYFIFALVGMAVFGNLEGPGNDLNSYNNYSTFFGSLLLLFRMSTGEVWHMVYKETVWFHCDAELRLRAPEKCPITSIFTFYFTFYMATVILVKNLFIAIIIEIFAAVVSREYSDLAMEHVSDWVELWSSRCSYDSAGESYLSVPLFMTFISDIQEPLGVGKSCINGSHKLAVLQRIRELELVAKDGQIHFRDALHNAVKRVARVLNPATRETSRHLSGKYVEKSYMGVLLEEVKERKSMSHMPSKDENASMRVKGSGWL